MWEGGTVLQVETDARITRTQSEIQNRPGSANGGKQGKGQAKTARQKQADQRRRAGSPGNRRHPPAEDTAETHGKLFPAFLNPIYLHLQKSDSKCHCWTDLCDEIDSNQKLPPQRFLQSQQVQLQISLFFYGHSERVVPCSPMGKSLTNETFNFRARPGQGSSASHPQSDCLQQRARSEHGRCCKRHFHCRRFRPPDASHACGRGRKRALGRAGPPPVGLLQVRFSAGLPGLAP